MANYSYILTIDDRRCTEALELLSENLLRVPHKARKGSEDRNGADFKPSQHSRSLGFG